MAKKIIILEHISQPSDADYRFLFWLDVPAARQRFYAALNANFVSAYLDATTDEITALRNGSVVEQVGTIPRPAGTTLNQLTTALVSQYNAAQTAFTNTNHYDRYGSSWDGTSWTSVTVA